MSRKKDAIPEEPFEEIKPVIPEEKITTTDEAPEGYTAEEWADLSDTEREGIMDSILNPEGDEETEAEPTDEEKAALKEIAGDEETEEERVAREADEKAKADQLVKDEAEAKKAGKTVEEVVAAREAIKPTETPVVEEEAPTSERLTDEQLLGQRITPDESLIKVEVVVPATMQAEYTQKMADLKTKRESGDINPDEYLEQRDTLKEELSDWKAEERDRIRASERAGLQWATERAVFLEARPEYIERAKDKDGKLLARIDLSTQKEMPVFTPKSKALWGAFSEFVKEISGDPKNGNLTGMQILIKADRMTKEQFGIKPEASLKLVKKEEKPPASRPDHKTLSGIPPAAPQDEDGVYSQLDRLRGPAYEAALERLSPEQRDRYASEAGRRRV